MKEAPSLAREVCNLLDLGANGEELRNQETIIFDQKDSVIALVIPMRNLPTKLTFQTSVFGLTC